METNPQIELAFDFVQYTGTNVFLTGKAGTGKTTFLRKLKQISPKRMIVLAPTGVAAINAGGVTIHSFFQLPFGPYVVGKSVQMADKEGHVNRFSKTKIDIIRSLDLLVIDEISMVRADLLDAVDGILRRFKDHSRPFGGVQLLMIGDLQQLAPVVKEDEWALLKEYYDSPFFFNSIALRETSYISIELTHVFRQSDRKFIDLLNKIRDNRTDEATLRELNSRYIPRFDPKDEEGYITLTTHNYQAQRLNGAKMDALVEKAYSFAAEITGNFPEYSFPTDQHLILKKGAQVMFVQNDTSSEKRYYNGKIGMITAISQDRIVVKSEGDAHEIAVAEGEWTNTKYTIDPETRDIIETVEGTFKQYPLKAAWAITIHKSQGLTFERAIIDAGSAFTHGQVYVALSRCKTLEGLVLSSPVNRYAVINDHAIKNFTEYIGQNQPGSEQLKNARRAYYLELLADCFDYKPLLRRIAGVARVYNEHLANVYPEQAALWREKREKCHTEIADVGDKFKPQLHRLVMQSADYEYDEVLKERIGKGMNYFNRNMAEIVKPLLEKGMPEIDNKEVAKSLNEALGRLHQEAMVKLAVLEACSGEFTIKHYLEAKAKSMLEKSKVKKQPEKVVVSDDIQNPVLYKTLLAWRKTEAERYKLPAYTILHQRALVGICNLLPADRKELMKIPGIGKKTIEKYGAALLEIVDEFRFQH